MRNAPSLRRRVLSGFGGAGVVILLVVVASGIWLDRAFQDLGARLGDERVEDLLVAEFRASVLQELQAGHRYLVTGDPRHLATYQELAARTYSLHQEVITHSDGSVGVSQALIPVQSNLFIAEAVLSRAHRLAEIGQGEAAQAALDQGSEYTDGVLTGLERLAEVRTEQRRAAVESLTRDARRTGLLILLVLSGGFGVAFLVSRSNISDVIRATESLADHADRIEAGQLDTRTDVASLPEELRSLGEALNNASHSLDELDRKKEALQRAEKLSAIGLMLSGVAHELNNPLASILATSQELLDTPPDELPREGLVTVRDQARRARSLVRKLLMTAHEDTEVSSTVAFEGSLDRLQTDMDRVAAEHDVALVWEIPDDLPRVPGDAAGIESLMSSLVENAMWAAGEGGHVWVRLVAEDDHVRVVVEDDGPGIDPAIRSKIFDPFFTTKPAGEGVGLGLSVALGLARSVGGEVVAEDRAEGGARFVATLPTVRDSARTDEGPAEDHDSDPAPDDDPAPVDALRVLVVDDEQPIRSTLRRFFERRGWSVAEAENGQEALAAITDDPDAFDVILSDLRMPVMTGMELVDRLVTERPELEGRFLIMTGDKLAPGPADFLERTTLPVVEKPFELAELIRRVESVARSV